MQYRQVSGNARCHGLGGDAGKALTCKVGLIRGTKNCPQTAYDKGEQQSYSKFGIVVNDVNDTRSTQSLQPESVNVKVQVESNTAKRSRCLWCRAHSATQQLARQYHRLVALYRQRDLVCCLLYRSRGFGRPTCACRAFLLRLELRRPSSPFFTVTNTWIFLCIGPTVVDS